MTGSSRPAGASRADGRPGRVGGLHDLFGLTNRTEAVVAALRLLRRQAREAAVLAALDAEYGPDGVLPPGAVTAGLEALIAEEDAAVAAGNRSSADSR